MRIKNFLIVFFLVSYVVSNAHGDHDSSRAAISYSDSATFNHVAESDSHTPDGFFPNYHPLIIHFPIVLLILAALTQICSFFLFKKELKWITIFLLFFGVLTAWLASNVLHAHPKELQGRVKEIFEIHEQMASLTLWISLIGLIIKLCSLFIFKGKLWVEIIAAIILICSTITVSICGHHGAMLVHIEGIGPQGNGLETHHHHHED